MKKIRATILSFTAPFILFISILSITFSLPAQRNYYCRMPPRVEAQNSNLQKLLQIATEKDSNLFNSLFGDFELSEKKTVRLKNLCSNYSVKIRRLTKNSNKMANTGVSSADKKITKTTVSFLNSIKRELSPEQYEQFNKKLNGNPNGIGPIVKGPDPLLMTEEK